MLDIFWILKHKILGRNRYYEQEVMDTVKHIKGSVFVDVGAHIGRYSKRLAGNFETVYAFEPNPSYWNELREAIPRNVAVLGWALSNVDGRALLYTDPLKKGGSADTLVKEFDYKPANNSSAWQRFTGNDVHSYNVHTQRFDSWLEKTKFTMIDLVKIDVEGAEFMVLQGMESALKKKRVKYLIVELHDSTRKSELEGLFQSYGYQYNWLDSEHLFASWFKPKLIAVTADYEPSFEKPFSEPDREKSRLIDPVLDGTVKPVAPNTSEPECYCDTCKSCFIGTWFKHQEIVHGRLLP